MDRKQILWYDERRDQDLSWDKNRDAAADAGTKLHYDIECYYNGMQVENSSVEYQHFLDFLRVYEELVPYRTEWFVYHERCDLQVLLIWYLKIQMVVWIFMIGRE